MSGMKSDIQEATARKSTCHPLPGPVADLETSYLRGRAQSEQRFDFPSRQFEAEGKGVCSSLSIGSGAERDIPSSDNMDLREACSEDDSIRESIGDHPDNAVDKSRSSVPITLELLSEGGYYDMPMSKVAHLLGRTEGSFQRVCRSLGILRWPYRVRKSLQAIMDKTEQYLDDNAQEDGMSKAEVLRVLQTHMDDIKGISGSGMDKATKQYRQYIFKVNHKLSRKAAKMGDAAAGENHKIRGMLRAASKIQKTNLRPDKHRDDCSNGRALRQKGAVQKMHCERLHLPPSPTLETRQQYGGNLQPKDSQLEDTLRDHGRAAPLKPTRPTPRHFRDLPASLAFEPLGREKAGPSNIVGRLATYAALQNRLRAGSTEDYRRVCLKEDEELLQLCLEMDAHLAAAQELLSSYNQGFSPQYHPLSPVNQVYQHFFQPPLGMAFHPFLQAVPTNLQRGC